MDPKINTLPKNAPKLGEYGPEPPNLLWTPLRALGSPDLETFCPPIGALLAPQRAVDTPQLAYQPKARKENLRYSQIHSTLTQTSQELGLHSVRRVKQPVAAVVFLN